MSRERTYPTSLRGAGRYLAAPEETAKATGNDLFSKANSLDVRVILNGLGAHIPEGAPSWKFRCPLGAEHSDGGMDKGARYYASTNSAYCFALHGPLTPVRLTSLVEGISEKRAALMLAEEHGIRLVRNYREKFADVAAEVEALKARGSTLSLQYAVESLQVYLTRLPEYTRRQYDTEVREAMEIVLDDLGGLTDASLSGLQDWLTRAKDVMREAVLSGRVDSSK